MMKVSLFSEKSGKAFECKMQGIPLKLKTKRMVTRKCKKLLIFARTIWDTIFSSLLLIMKKCMVRIRNITVFSLQDKKGDTQEDYNKIGEDILTQDGALSVSYMRDIEKQLDDMLKSLNLVIVVLIISAGMLAFVVLYNLNTVNITERQRELATLKVLGFYDLEVAESRIS